MAGDTGALYDLSQTGIPEGYTSNLQALGYRPTPFAPPEQVWENQFKFQQLLKRIMDSHIQGWKYGTNLDALPFNFQDMFQRSALALQDPNYGIRGSIPFYENGYKMGDMPANRPHMYETWYNKLHNYPNLPPPVPLGAGTQQAPTNNNSSWEPSNQSNNQPAQQDSGQHQVGGTPGGSDAVYVNKDYGDMSDEEKDQANQWSRENYG